MVDSNARESASRLVVNICASISLSNNIFDASGM